MDIRENSIQISNVVFRNRIRKIKLVLLGESAVGKSSLALRLVKGYFRSNQEITIGVQFFTSIVCADDMTHVQFELWDTAGVERYLSLAPIYYRNAKAAIVVYDITNQDSFDKANLWVEELKVNVKQAVVIALIGNKADQDNKRMVETKKAQDYADENGLLFMETSAKTAMNVDKLFLEIAKKLPKYEEVNGICSSRFDRRLDMRENPKLNEDCCI